MIYKDDTDLWKSFKKGDINAFRHIYKAHYNGLYYFALKVTQDHVASVDCLQNLFINLWDRRNHLSDVYSIRAYLFKALRRDLHRINAFPNKKESQWLEVLQFQVAPTFSPEDILVEDETKQFLSEQVAKVLNALPIRQREVVYLKYYEGLSYQEIASIMGINYQSVVNLLYKAMVNLKKEENLQQLSALLAFLPLLLSLGYYFFM